MKRYLLIINFVAALFICSCTSISSCRNGKQKLYRILKSSDLYANIELTDIVVHDSATAADIDYKKWILSGSVESMDDYMTLREDLIKHQLFDLLFYSVEVKSHKSDNTRIFIKPIGAKPPVDDRSTRYIANVAFGESVFFDIAKGITWSGVYGRDTHRRDFTFSVAENTKGQTVKISILFDSNTVRVSAPPEWEKEKHPQKTPTFSYIADYPSTVYFHLKFQAIVDGQSYELRGQCRVLPDNVKIAAIQERVELPGGIGVRPKAPIKTGIE